MLPTPVEKKPGVTHPNYTAPPAVRRAASKILPQVARRLSRQYGSACLGNKRNPLDELVYIQLSIRTRESAYQRTYLALRRLVGGAWGRLLELPNERAIAVLNGGGMARIKVARLRGMFEAIRDNFGVVSLAPLRHMSDNDAELFLRSLPGVGPKAARCVLLYSLGRDVFPVDSHCRRVLGRLGFLPVGTDAKASHDLLQSIVPKGIRRSLHVNLIHHGRSVCVTPRPHCGRCVLLDICATGRGRVNSDIQRSGNSNRRITSPK
jgi:endonuclease III